MAYLAHFTNIEKFIKLNNKIPEYALSYERKYLLIEGIDNRIPLYAREYKREYLFIKGINSQLKFLIKKLDSLNHGLFESKRSTIIKNIMKNFLRKQEEGKLKNISDVILPIEFTYNIYFINEQSEYYKLGYDAFCDMGDRGDRDVKFYDIDGKVEYFVDGKPYPGFIEFYDIFKKIYCQIKNENNDSDDEYYDYDSDDYDYETNILVFDSDSDNDNDCQIKKEDSDSDSDSDDEYYD